MKKVVAWLLRATATPSGILKLALGAWVIASLLTALVVVCGGGPWIELFNGATWPDRKYLGQGVFSTVLFYILLGFRTLVNLGGVLGLAWALYLLVRQRLEAMYMRNLSSILSNRDTKLTAVLIKTIQDVQGRPVDDALVERLFSVAQEFGDTDAGKIDIKEAALAQTPPPQNR